MKIVLWKGYHHPDLLSLIQAAWSGEQLLVLCPPLLKDFSFVQHLPEGDISFHGEWSESERAALPRDGFSKYRAQSLYPATPVLGVFTSGSISGRPRLVLYSKKNIESSLNGILSVFDAARITSIFCYPQPFHTFGLLLGYVQSIRLGIPLHTPEGKYTRDSHQKRARLADPGLLTLGTPTHFYDLIHEDHGLAPSYSCIIGGAPVTVRLWNSIRDDLRIEKPSIGYGCTEACPGITHHPPGQPPREDSEIGFPLKDAHPEPLHGEGVRISGPSLCLATIDEAGIKFPSQLTIRDDIEVRPDGMWLYRGRLDLILNRGGQKYSLEQIELVLAQKLDVSAVALAVKDERFGEDLGLLLKGQAPKNLGDLVREEFGIQIKTSHLREVREFPQNESLKLDRKACRRLFEEVGSS
ncbi:MAG: acyl--CoA ligase [Bdellovibrionaceae bacterium]|nr:acyl--CoA ligase [Pseudobdellovibrionaceae bacterium]